MQAVSRVGGTRNGDGRAARPLGFALGAALTAALAAAPAGARAEARIYEALPSLLFGLNGLPTYHDRLDALHGATGPWARLEAQGGKWKAESSTAAASGIAYDYTRYGVRAGLDLARGPGDRDSVGISMHYRHGTAELPEPAGRIMASGFGIGVSGARRFEGGTYDGVYVGGQFAATWYEAELESLGELFTTGAVRLKRGAAGFGYAAALEVGRALALDMAGTDGMTVTPRGRIAHSQVQMTGFTDAEDNRVTLDRARGLTGRVGVRVEAAPAGFGDSLLFGSVDVEGALRARTRATVSGTPLESKAPATGARVELGWKQEQRDGRYALRGAAHYATVGKGAGYGGTLSLKLRF